MVCSLPLSLGVVLTTVNISTSVSVDKHLHDRRVGGGQCRRGHFTATEEQVWRPDVLRAHCKLALSRQRLALSRRRLALSRRRHETGAGVSVAYNCCHLLSIIIYKQNATGRACFTFILHEYYLFPIIFVLVIICAGCKKLYAIHWSCGQWL